MDPDLPYLSPGACTCTLNGGVCWHEHAGSDELDGFFSDEGSSWQHLICGIGEILPFAKRPSVEVRPTLALGPGSASSPLLVSDSISCSRLLNPLLNPTSARHITQSQMTRGSSDARTAKLLPLTMKCCDDSYHGRQTWGWKKTLTIGIGPEQKSALLLDPGRKSRVTIVTVDGLLYFGSRTRRASAV